MHIAFSRETFVPKNNTEIYIDALGKTKRGKEDKREATSSQLPHLIMNDYTVVLPQKRQSNNYISRAFTIENTVETVRGILDFTVAKLSFVLTVRNSNFVLTPP